MSKSDRSSQANLSIKAINQARDEADTTPPIAKDRMRSLRNLNEPPSGVGMPECMQVSR